MKRATRTESPQLIRFVAVPVPRGAATRSSTTEEMSTTMLNAGQAGRNGTSTRVLLVEDDNRIAGPLTEGLSRYGFAVERVGTGADALAAAPADLVLLNL